MLTVLSSVCRLVIVLCGRTNCVTSDSECILYVHVCSSALLTRQRNLSIYRAANSVYGKIGRIASQEVTLQIMDSKCITYATLWARSSSFVEVRQVIFRFCNRPILHETLSNKLH